MGWHEDCSKGGMAYARELSGNLLASGMWDDEPTLVHPREVRMDVPAIPPMLPACLSRVQRELTADELWLQSLPAATRAVLEDARRVRPLDAPRLAFAVAQPI